MLIILATVGINFAFGENGLITKAKQAKEMTEIASLKEQLDMSKVEAYIDGEGIINKDNYFDILEGAGIINGEENITDLGDGSYEIVTEDGYVFETTFEPNEEEADDVKIEYVGKDEEARITKITVEEKAEGGIEVIVETTNVEGGEYTYSYKKKEESEWTQAGVGSENRITINGLEEPGTYEIKVTIEIGEEVIERTVTVEIGAKGEIPEGAITIGEVKWIGDGTAEVEIQASSEATGYTIQYQKNTTEGQWTEIGNGEKITGLVHGDTVYVRLTDGVNESEYAIKQITDDIPPEVNIQAGQPTSNSVQITVTATDGQSGLAENGIYTYYLNDEEKASNNTNTYTFTGLTQGTRYTIKVVVTDKAGKTTEKSTEITTASIPGGDTEEPDQEGAITFGNIQWSSNKARVQVSTTTSYQIEYQVNSTSGRWTQIENNGTIENLNYNDTVYARLTDGSNVGEYATLVITDDILPEVSIQAGVPTSNSVTLTVTATDEQSGLADSGIYTYYLNNQEKASNNTSTYTYTGLTQGTRYTLKVVVKDKAGKTTEKSTEITTASIPGGDTEEPDQEGTITFTNPTWSSNKASVQVSTNTGYQIEYQLNSTSGQWTTIGNNGTIENLNYNDTVYARLTDGSNVGEYATLVITDDIPPEVSIQAGEPTSNSVQVTVTATDGQSGLAESGIYTYYLNDQEKASNNTNTYTYTGLIQGTKYTLKVVVKDKAGKTTEKSTEITTANIPGGDTEEPGQEGAITFGSIQWSSNKASVQVSTTTSYKIEYQVNSTSGQWTQITNNGTIENLNYNDTVYARLTDGSNVGNYATLVITDDIPPEVSIQAGTPTSNSITLTVTATDGQSGLAESEIYTYYLNDEEKASNNTNAYTFTGLTQGTRYTLKVVVKDKAGKTTEKTTEITTLSIPSGTTEGAITFGEVRWSNNKASIQVTTNTSYTIEYQINGTEEGQWKTIQSGETIGELLDGNTVNVRLTDGNNVGQMISKNIEDNIAPKVVVAGGGTTSNSVKVVVTAEDGESGMISSPTYTYYIKESTEGEDGYEVPSGATGIGENTYTFTGLKQGTSYDVKVEVNGDVAGNKGTGEIKGQITASIPSGETGGVITFGNTTWSSNKASVQVSTSTSYQIEYQVNSTSGQWTKIENNGNIGNLNHNDTVYARLTDGINVGDYATLVIKDEIAPEVEIQAGAPTSNSVSITVTAVDGQSGLADSGIYTYYLNNEQKASNNTNTYTYTGLTQGTQYTLKVVVKDKAGKTTEKTTSITTLSIPAGTGAITFTNPTWSSNKASVQVNTNTGYQIEYQVNSTSGSWTKIASGGTIGNLNHNDNVYARLTDGNNVGSHATCAIKDDIAPTVSISTSGLTYNSVKLTVTASDAQSGLADSGRYTYYLNNSQKASNNTNSYTFTGLSATTTYTLKVVVRDKAGKTTERTTQITTPVTPISSTASYVGYYADVDGNGSVDGVIYADLAIGGSGQWENSNGTYTIPKGSNFKTYTVSGSHTENGFGTKDVIKVANGSGNERFYVMALSDVDSSSHHWYDEAGKYNGNMDDYATTTSGDFGAGEKNTQNMIAKWNSNAYGFKNTGIQADMWGLSAVQNGTWNGSSGWYVPSKEEWAAFGAAFGITNYNDVNFGLDGNYWSSSQYDKKDAWEAGIGYGYMRNANVSSYLNVRLSTTF